MRTETITSAQNQKIKLLLELQEKSKTRRKEGLFVVEGQREFLHCIESGYKAHTLFICPDLLTEKQQQELEDAIAMRLIEGYESPISHMKAYAENDKIELLAM